MMLHPVDAEQARRAHAAQLMVEAMQRDTAAQHGFIEARARGETDAVYWEHAPHGSERQDLYEERHRFREQVQCTMIRAHLAIEGVRAEIARSRALLGLN